MATLPYIQLYVSDYLADTMHLTAEEHGAYMLLIMNYWQTEKPIPENRLQGVTRMFNDRWDSVKQTLNEFFEIDENGDWFHKRIQLDLQKVKEKSKQASKAGKLSALKRAEKKGVTKVRSTTVQHKSNDRSTIEEKREKRKDIYTPLKKDVIDYLNQVTSKNFRSIDNKFLNARINEGYKFEDFRKVIDVKSSQWLNTEHDKYLRPDTLFGNKFESYLNENISAVKVEPLSDVQLWGGH